MKKNTGAGIIILKKEPDLMSAAKMLKLENLYNKLILFKGRPYSSQTVSPGEIDDATFEDIYPVVVAIALKNYIRNNSDKLETQLTQAFPSGIIPAEALKDMNVTDYGINLGTIYVSSNIKEIAAKAFSNSSIRKLLMGSSLVKVGSGAFKGCENLTGADFRYSKFQTVSADTFSDCPNLKTVILPKTLHVILPHAFDNVNSDIKIYVPFNKVGEQVSIPESEMNFFKQHLIPYNTEPVQRVMPSDTWESDDDYDEEDYE